MSDVAVGVRDSVLRRVNKPLWYLVHRLSGIRLSVVIHMQEIGQIGAGFPIHTDAVREWLPSKRLEPVEYAPGKTALTIYGNDFRRVKLVGRPYAEVAIGVPIRYADVKDNPAFEGVFYLFVVLTAQEGVWSGKEIYGFPKVLGEVQFEEDSGVVRYQASADGKDLLKLEVQQAPLVHQSYQSNAFTVLDGKLVCSLWEAEGEIGRVDEPGGAFCTLGDHPWAERLRDAGMESTSVWHMYGPRQQGILHKPAKKLPL
jgi:hypothetical protein